MTSIRARLLYRDDPHLPSTAKLAGLGWEPTPVEAAMARTVADHLEGDRDGTENGPARSVEERVFAVLGTV